MSLVGHSSNDDEYSVSATDNTTELCSVESTCLMNNNSDICQSLGPSSPVWGRADINPDGNIFECDDSNSVIDQAVCRVLDQCHQSSKYPIVAFLLLPLQPFLRIVSVYFCARIFVDNFNINLTFVKINYSYSLPCHRNS